jgi:hypothetical protein
MTRKLILSAVGVAVLLTSPAMAKQIRSIDAVPSTVPGNSRGTAYNEAARAQIRLMPLRTLNQNGYINEELNLEGYPR